MNDIDSTYFGDFVHLEVIEKCINVYDTTPGSESKKLLQPFNVTSLCQRLGVVILPQL